MSNYWKIGISFIVGTIVGSLITKKLIDRKSVKIEEELIPYDQLEEVSENDTDECDNNEPIVTENDKNEYNRLLGELKYNRTNEDVNNLEECIRASDADLIYDDDELDVDHDGDYDELATDEPLYAPGEFDGPYYIDSEEFMAIDDYDAADWTWYTDNWVTDDAGLPIQHEEVQRIIGGCCLRTRFRDTGKDELFIRNDELRLDISIARDLENFEDVAPPRLKRMAGLM